MTGFDELRSAIEAAAIAALGKPSDADREEIRGRSMTMAFALSVLIMAEPAELRMPSRFAGRRALRQAMRQARSATVH